MNGRKEMAYKIINRGLLTLTILALVLYPGCSNRGNQNGNGQKEEDPAIPVEVTEVIKGSVSANYSGTTTLETEDEALVVAKVRGIVKRIFAEEGDTVRAGQVLAKLEDEQFVSELAQAKARLDKLSNEFQRKQKLFEKEIISIEDFDQIKSEHEIQKSTYDLAKLNLNYTQIRAPISGVVSERLIKPGNMVTENQPTFRVTDFDPLLAVLHVPEKELSKMQVGFPADLTVDAVPDHSYQGKILRISPIISAGTGTFKVTVEFRDKTRRLKPGMFTRVNIVYDVHEDTLLLPKDAILSEDIESSVFILKQEPEAETEGENKPETSSNSETEPEPEKPIETWMAYKQSVEIGYINSSHVEILSGVSLGDVVVTTGISSLKDGAKVKVVGR